MGFKSILNSILTRIISEKVNYLHAEALASQKEWEILKKEVRKGYTWFVPTPADYEYCNCIFNLNMDKEGFSNAIRDRITFLKENNEDIQLSIQFSKRKNFLDKEMQIKRFKEATTFLNSLGIKAEKFIPIDGVYDENTKIVAKEHCLLELTNLNLFVIKPMLFLLKKLGLKQSFIEEIYYSIKRRDFKSVAHLFLSELIDENLKTIHVEAYIRDDVWSILKRKIIGRGYIWYIITPANYDYCKSYFNIKTNKKEFTSTLKNRIEYLKKKNEEIQLHIHLGRYKQFLSKEIQEAKFKEALEFLTPLGIKPTKFVAGWWTYNKDTIDIAKKYGIEEISDYNINPFLKTKYFEGMKIKYVHKYWHDFEFI